MQLQDFVINEGLRRWDVRYYLAAVQSDRDGGFRLKVAFEVRRVHICEGIALMTRAEHHTLLSGAARDLSRCARRNVRTR